MLNIKWATLSVYPSRGTGVPHFKSRVMQRGLRPSLTHELAITRALWVQPVVTLSIQLVSLPSSCIIKPHNHRLILRKEMEKCSDLRQIEEKVFWCLNNGGMTTHFTPWWFQLDGVDQLTAFVALVPSSILIATQGTSPFHESIRKKSAKREVNFTKYLEKRIGKDLLFFKYEMEKENILHFALLAQKLFHSVLG